MTRDDLVLKILEAHDLTQVIHLLRDHLHEVDMKDSNGDRVHSGTSLACHELIPKTSGFPYIRLEVTLQGLTIRVGERKVHIPLETTCETLDALDSLHDAWHVGFASIIAQLVSESKQNPDVLQKILGEGRFSQN